jgi:hypothetical protein
MKGGEMTHRTLTISRQHSQVKLKRGEDMKEPSVEAPADLLQQVRKLLPRTQINFGEACIVAQLQALRLRKLLDTDAMRLPLGWIEDIPNIKVDLKTPMAMEPITKALCASGATTIHDDRVHIYLDESNTPTHLRWTLCHELYHVITGPFEGVAFANLGRGNADLRRRRIENLADHFAANLLVPSRLLRQAWGSGIQDLRELADFFGVSEDAMQIRLKKVGLIRSGITKQMFYRRPHLALAGLQ